MVVREGGGGPLKTLQTFVKTECDDPFTRTIDQTSPVTMMIYRTLHVLTVRGVLYLNGYSLTDIMIPIFLCIIFPVIEVMCLLHIALVPDKGRQWNIFKY